MDAIAVSTATDKVDFLNIHCPPPDNCIFSMLKIVLGNAKTPLPSCGAEPLTEQTTNEVHDTQQDHYQGGKKRRLTLTEV